MVTTGEVKAQFEARLRDSPNHGFHPLDLDRLKDEKYLKRVLKHVDNDTKQAVEMLWDIFSWRKSVGANDINESTIRMDYVNEGIFFPRGRDVDGCLLLIIKSKMHVKGQKEFEEIKKAIIYWFDRIEREENGNKMTLFFDLDTCGLSNMDMELTNYLIMLFKCYYPFFLNYIIIYQMPWVMSTAFKVIKSLLPAKAVEKMKFVNKDTLKDYVTPEQALSCWGGQDNYTFEFVPENRNNLENTSKKVTFAEQGDSQHSPGEMLRISPNDTIMFKAENDEISGQFTITNMDESVVSFKIRTTAPEKFRVRPSSGVLPSGASQTIIIVVQSGFQMKIVTKDRFLVMSVQIPKADLTQKEIADIWQNSSGSKVDEYRLKCNFPEKSIQKNGNMFDKGAEKSDTVSNALNNLQMNYETLHRQVNKLKVYQLLTLILTAVAVLLGFLVYKNSSNQDRYCEMM